VKFLKLPLALVDNSQGQWGGYMDIITMLDENGLWAMYTTSAHSGITLVKLDEDLEITETWKVPSSAARTYGAIWMMGGVLYATESYSTSSTRINLRYDTSISEIIPTDISFKNGSTYNSSMSYCPEERIVFSVDNSGIYRYDPVFT